MVSNVKRTAGDPDANRLTRIGSRLADLMKNDPEYRADDKAIVMINDGQEAGITLDGYASDGDAVKDLFTQLDIIARANGAQLVITSPGDN